MLCCLWQDPSSVVGNDPTSNTGVSLFPGQRRSLTKPSGNASTPAAPFMVNVVVPPGMAPGQTLQVQAPDGSRTVNAIIPRGLESGQTFFVTFPSVADSTATNQSSHTVIGTSPHSGSGNAQTSAPSPVAAPVMSSGDANHIAAPVMPPANQSTIPFSQVLDGPPPNMSPQPSPSAMLPNSNNNNHNSDRKLLLVNVPPGSEPGSTLYVSVPGENRTLAAKVPHGVTQFHVAYEPRAVVSGTTPPAPAPAPVPSANPLPTYNDNGQKLILVRVPPGTVPGTTLHVTVPDEPGRVLAAEVPPNVSEFQVAYIPRALQQQSQSQQQQSYGQSHYNSNAGTMNHGGMGMMNNAMLPFIGGAALGAAGLGMYDHYHHHGGYQDYNGDAGYDYGDSGGYGDYGGGDFGGGDF